MDVSQLNTFSFVILFATTSGSDETSEVSGSGGNFEVEVLEVFRSPIHLYRLFCHCHFHYF
jgi:hypothetical protein